MIHSFDIEIAEKYGVDEAIILNNLFFWIQKNKANGKHYHNGSYWTYNSIKAFSILFPYWSKDHIRRVLRKMEDKGLINTGNFNTLSFDRTCWYAIPESVYSILQNCNSHLAVLPNGIGESAKPIPDIKPDIKPDINNKENIKENIFTDDFLNHRFSNSLETAIAKWLTYKKERKQTYKETGMETLIKKIKNKSDECGEQAVIDLIDLCISQNWSGIIWDKIEKGCSNGANEPARDHEKHRLNVTRL